MHAEKPTPPQDKSRELQRKLYRAAKRRRNRRFHALYDHIFRPDILRQAWEEVRRNGGSAGQDGVSIEDVEKEGVEQFLREIEQDLKAGSYCPKPVLRVYIPKADGIQRPLGIPTVRDRVVQQACKRVIEPIFEANFQDNSYGFRPKRSAQQAVTVVKKALITGWWVVDADIQGYFDRVNHDMLMARVARVNDKALLWKIEKWLKAGVLDTEGKTFHPKTGTPQGGIISPLLANVYLHYALDVWFQKVVIPHCHGEACLIRYADAFVCAFEKEEDAQRFYEVLGKRLGKFELELSAEKTQIIPFSPKGSLGKTSLNFLGFEFRWGKDRQGKPHVDRRTARKTLRNSQKRFNQWCKENRHCRLPELFHALNAKLRGYYNYYDVYGNLPSLMAFYVYAIRALWKHLNQRSQRKSYNWVGFKQLMKQFSIAKPHIVGRPKRGWRRVAPGLA